jgi:hypothetical protein
LVKVPGLCAFSLAVDQGAKEWRYLFAALRYAGERGVSIVITRIRE